MSRTIAAATIAALSSQHIRWLIFAKVEFDFATLAFNSSLESKVFDGDTYLGAGSLGNVSQAVESSGLDPAEYKITFSGVNDTVLSAAATEDYLNKRAIVHVAVLDEFDAIIGEPFIWFEGLTDSVDVKYGKQSTIVVNIRDRLTDWSRRRISRYTDGEQQSLHTGDKGLEFVTEVASRDIVWPAREWFRNNS
jgi:hypothetical protein